MKDEFDEEYENNDDPQDWRNLGGPHSHKMSDGTRQTVAKEGVLKDVRPSELKHFEHKFEPIIKRNRKPIKVEEGFAVEPGLTKGWFNVIRLSTGEPINDRNLRKKDAESLLNEMEADA